MNEKTNKILLTSMAIGMAVLIIINLNLNSRIGNMEANLFTMREMLSSDFHSSLYSMNQDISAKIDSINHKLVQDAKLSYDETAIIRDYQKASSSAYVDVGFNLKSFNPQDTVMVVARGVNGNTFDAVAKGSDAGRFTAEMTLPMQDNYVLSFTSMGAENISGELTTLSLAEELLGRFKYSYGASRGSYSSSSQQSMLRLYPQLTNYTKGIDALKIKEIFLIAESNGTELAKWDLLPQLQDSGDSQIIDEYRRQAQIMSGEIKVAQDETEISFILPDSSVTIRLLVTDSMGVKYEQTDSVSYVGLSDSQGGNSATSSIVPATPTEIREHGDGYIHFAN